MPTDTAITAACAHCGLPVPAGLIAPAEALQYCCQGCRTVHALLTDHGLGRYYDLRDPAQPAAPVRSGTRGYAEFDSEAFRVSHVQALADGSCRVALFVEGVHCAACVWLLERLPRLCPGVIEARLQFRKSLLHLTWDPAATPLSAVGASLDSLGYAPHPARSDAARAARTRADRRDLVRLAVAGACAGNAMLLAFALYAGEASGMQEVYHHAFRGLSLAVGLLCLAWPGGVFFRGAWTALRARRSHMDIPVALGLSVGAVSGAVATLSGRGDIYFDSLTVLVFLLLVGRYIQRRQQDQASDALELLFSFRSQQARRLEPDGQVREVPAESLQVGDRVELRGGDLAPADGVVESGSSRVDASVLTGESRPQRVEPGDSLCAGSQNLYARLVLRVTAAGEDTRVARLMALVNACSERRAPIVQLADRIAGRFVVVVLLLAGASLALWLHAGLPTAVDRTVALLIVACPCALGLATPLAMTVALGRAAREQILIKGAETLERLAGRGLILLDKTGTLTTGRVTLNAVIGDSSVQPYVAALEAAATHPVATALAAAWTPHADTPGGVTHWPRGGLCGSVGGRQVAAGSPAAFAEQGLLTPPDLLAAADAAAARGQTPVLLALDGRVAALAVCGDRLRDDARETLDRLRAGGWRVGVLSGDHPAVVAGIAAELGIPRELTWGGVSPEEKLAVIERLRGAETLVMVGDGVNDAAALAAADVGIAVHGGAEASLAAADIYLSRPGLAPIVALIARARGSMRVVRRGLAVSLAYNILAVSLALAGVLTPLLAAVIMPVSSITVLTLSFLQARRVAAASPAVPDPIPPPTPLRGAACP